MKERSTGQQQAIDRRSGTSFSFDEKSLGQTDYHALLDDPTYRFYLRLEKRFLDPASVDNLVMISDHLSEMTDPEYLSAAGWASAEAALVATNRSRDERHVLLQNAAEIWARAYDEQHNVNVANGLPADYFNAASMRLQLASMYVQLFQSMVDGDVTATVRDDLYHNVLYVAALNASALQDISAVDSAAAKQQTGLAHELNAMMAVNRLKSPTLIAMPSTARGGSGVYKRQDTHDIDLLHLQWGDIMHVTTLESKGKPQNLHYSRYKAAIVNGRVHLYTKNGKSPIDTVILFLKEHDGLLSGSDYRDVERMTDTIVHLARHQHQSAMGIPSQCRDVKNCTVVPKHRSVNQQSSVARLAVVT